MNEKMNIKQVLEILLPLFNIPQIMEESGVGRSFITTHKNGNNLHHLVVSKRQDTDPRVYKELFQLLAELRTNNRHKSDDNPADVVKQPKPKKKNYRNTIEYLLHIHSNNFMCQSWGIEQ